MVSKCLQYVVPKLLFHLGLMCTVVPKLMMTTLYLLLYFVCFKRHICWKSMGELCTPTIGTWQLTSLTLFNDYGWYFCVTVTPIKKIVCQSMDVPFYKLSSGAMQSIERSWYREVDVEQKTNTSKSFFFQSMTWKNKKQVMFLHTNNIGASSGHFMNRSTKGKTGQSILRAHRVQVNYTSTTMIKTVPTTLYH